jgi:ribosome-associated toxin RatA of RatAB toxin-antitoxin module
MPRYDACADVARTISNQAVAFERVDPEKELDVVIMNEPFRDITGQWRRAPVHIGVCAAPGLVLHILRDMQSRIDRIGSLDVSEIRRVR